MSFAPRVRDRRVCALRTPRRLVRAWAAAGAALLLAVLGWRVHARHRRSAVHGRTARAIRDVAREQTLHTETPLPHNASHGPTARAIRDVTHAATLHTDTPLPHNASHGPTTRAIRDVAHAATLHTETPLPHNASHGSQNLITTSGQRRSSFNSSFAPSIDVAHHNEKNVPVLICFCFDNELDLLHVKLEMLHKVADTFLITESTYGGNGLPKPALFDLHKHEPRFAKYLPQIQHVVDQKAPENTGRALGWGQTQRVKDMIGIELLSRYTGQDGVVFVSDMDEIPSVAAVEWARAHCCRPRETWTIDMPYFMYGLHWQALKTSKTTLTVRRMSDELEFWRTRNTGTRFTQTVVPLPAFVDPGVHCSYCTGVAENVLKLRHTNLVDGPPFLPLFFYDEALFAHLRSCGVTPQGRNLERASVQVPAFSMYPYLSLRDAQTFGICQDHAIPAREWPSVLPALKENRRLHLFPVDV